MNSKRLLSPIWRFASRPTPRPNVTKAALALAGREFSRTWPYYLSLGVAAALFGYHLYLIRDRDEAACFRAFKHNSWVGLAIFLGIAASYALPT